MKLPLRAVPRAELEEGGMRLIEDAAGDIVARVFEDEAAEALVLAANNLANMENALKWARIPIAEDCASYSTHRLTLQKIDEAFATLREARK
ncbi:hypothetical protein [Herbaspirillum huttiense]|uniref:Uncharacterized protein n=1 Tax=Herbaspirillum huttiense subsp. lycopersici TaxID=3074428 RepID=A0ABU2EGP7_9BURK|nr:hypothetical protein [Herbaspirillum huttiense]MDR9847055.1 hypothetical protein [Herbaspirillum huttiense SE1]